MTIHLEKELSRLKKGILEIGAHVESNLFKSLEAVHKLNANMVKEIYESDNKIDQLEVELEEQCLKIMALYHPVASDLRFVVSVLKINSDLERIGDLAVNIARIAAYLAEEEPVKVPFKFDEMSSQVRGMLKKALDSLVNMDAKQAHQVCVDDDGVDAIHRKMYGKVYQGINDTPSHAKALIHYLSISRHLERVADMTTNIAEDVIYMIEGVIIRHHLNAFDSISE